MISLRNKLREYDWFAISVFGFLGIFLCAIIGIPIYQHIITKEIELCDCEFQLVSESNRIITDVWAIEKVGILDQEYVISTTKGKYRFRVSAIATYQCSKNGTFASIKRGGFTGEWRVVTE